MSNDIVTEFAPAKINLLLHVGQKRSDGFHALESLVVFASAGDELRFETAQDLSLAIEGLFARGLRGEADNLVLRAARALAETAKVLPRARIVLSKNLPVASGIGGGSSDAASALRGLARLWNVSVPRETMAAIAASLGSDVPVCLEPVSSWMEGRGETVSASPQLPPLALLLVNPGVAVPTGKVFAGLRNRRGVGSVKPKGWSSAGDFIAYLKTTANDLEAPACEIAQAISDAVNAISDCPDCLLARMSGSGATCFGLFESETGAEEAANGIRAAHPDWWVASARVL